MMDEWKMMMKKMDKKLMQQMQLMQLILDLKTQMKETINSLLPFLTSIEGISAPARR